MSGPRRDGTDSSGSGEVWLSVQDASAMLGVSPATLRRWSAAGEVEAFTTPGGHRRFARSTIQRLLPDPVGASATLAALGESPERVVRLVGRHAQEACARLGWVDETDADTRRLLRAEGRTMVAGLLAYVDGRSRHESEAGLAPALRAAAVHGRLAAEHGGELGATVGAFHRFRGILVDDLADLACRHGLPAAEVSRILGRVNDGADRLVVALVQADAAARVRDTG